MTNDGPMDGAWAQNCDQCYVSIVFGSELYTCLLLKVHAMHFNAISVSMVLSLRPATQQRALLFLWAFRRSQDRHGEALGASQFAQSPSTPYRSHE